MYILVEFTDDHDVAVIPDNWIRQSNNKKLASWPSHLKQEGKLEMAVKNKAEPGESWPSYPIKEMYRNESYSSVRERLRRAENESDLNTTQDSDSEVDDDDYRRSKRQKKVPSRLYSSEEDTPMKRQPVASSSTSGCSPSDSRAGDPTLFPLRPSPIHVQDGQSSLQGMVRKTLASATTPIRATTPISGTTRSEVARDIRIFTILEKISRQQAEILDVVNKVAGVVSSGQVNPTELPTEIDLPVTTLDQVDAIEISLVEPGCFNGLVTYLSLQGGVTRVDMTKRILARVMSNQLALQFNWYGKKGKRAFGTLKLAQAVLKAVMRSKKVTSSEVELDCREWFRLASDRDGGRKRRQKNTAEIIPNLEPQTPE